MAITHNSNKAYVDGVSVKYSGKGFGNYAFNAESF